MVYIITAIQSVYSTTSYTEVRQKKLSSEYKEVLKYQQLQN